MLHSIEYENESSLDAGGMGLYIVIELSLSQASWSLRSEDGQQSLYYNLTPGSRVHLSS